MSSMMPYSGNLESCSSRPAKSGKPEGQFRAGGEDGRSRSFSTGPLPRIAIVSEARTETRREIQPANVCGNN
jgi:hypothetical protein